MSAEAPVTLDLAGRCCVACGGSLQPIGGDDARVRCACGAQYGRHVKLGHLGRDDTVSVRRSHMRRRKDRPSTPPSWWFRRDSQASEQARDADIINRLLEWTASVERRRESLRSELASIETAIMGLCVRKCEGRPWPTKISRRPEAAIAARRMARP